MMYLVYLTDRWGVDTYNILICNTQEQAECLITRYDKLKKRFNNLSEDDVQHRQDEIPKLADDLQIRVEALEDYLQERCDMYFEEVNYIKAKRGKG